MAWVLGETVAESFDVGTTGQTFTRTASYINGSSSVFVPTFTEISDGFYRYSYTPAVAGSFEWVGTSTNGTPVTINFDVEATGVTVVVAASASGAATHTRAELRRRIAERFEDYEPLVATANGTTSTIVDTYHVNDATRHWNGRDVICTSGTNNGLRRRVTATVSSTGTLTLSSPVLTAATAANDTFDTFNVQGRGFAAERYDRAINNAIADAWPTGGIEIEATIVAAFDADTGEITLPATVAEVWALEAQDSSGRWYQVPKAGSFGGDGWWADKSQGELRLYGSRAWDVDTLSLRVFGLGRHPSLTADTDTCAHPPSFIVAHAAYHLALGAVGNDEMAVRVNLFRDEMERYRTQLRKLRPPMSSKVRAA